MDYDCSNNPLPYDFGLIDLNILPNTIDDSPLPDKRSRYTPYLLPAAISVSSEKCVSSFTTPSDSPQVILLTSDNPNPHHAIKKDNPGHVRVKRSYRSRRRHGKRCYKNTGFIVPRVLLKTRNFSTAVVF